MLFLKLKREKKEEIEKEKLSTFSIYSSADCDDLKKFTFFHGE
jgi:hypothetical protein